MILLVFSVTVTEDVTGFYSVVPNNSCTSSFTVLHTKYLKRAFTRHVCVCVPPLTDLGRVSPPGHVLGPDGLLDAVHLQLVALAVAGGVLLRLLQSRLQGFDPLSRSSKTLFQFRKLTAQVCIITHQLWDRLDVLDYFFTNQAQGKNKCKGNKSKEERGTRATLTECCSGSSFKSYLFVNLGELLKIVLKKGDFLFLSCAPPRIVRVHLSTLHNKDGV